VDRDHFLGMLLGEGAADKRPASTRTRGSRKGLLHNRVAQSPFAQE
jgi:hypothetical protein